MAESLEEDPRKLLSSQNEAKTSKVAEESSVFPAQSNMSRDTDSESARDVGSEQEKDLAASDAFCARMVSMIPKDNVVAIVASQNRVLSKFEKTNEKFQNFNQLSALRYEVLNQRFQHHTKMLLDMKKGLNVVFRRIRTLKTKLSKHYGYAFTATSENIQKLEELVEEDQDEKEEKPKSSELNAENTSRTELTNATSSEDSKLTEPKSSESTSGGSSSETEQTIQKTKSVDSEKGVVELADSNVAHLNPQVRTDASAPSEQQPFRLRPTLSSSDDSDLESDECTSSLSDSSNVLSDVPVNVIHGNNEESHPEEN